MGGPGALIPVGARNPCVKLTLPSYLLTNNNDVHSRDFDLPYTMITEWSAAEWSACYSDYTEWSAAEWSAAVIIQNGLRLLDTGGTGHTAVTSEQPHKEKFAFGSNNTGRNSTKF